jgi:predicted Holliday junction resolvase-like endonuclease
MNELIVFLGVVLVVLLFVLMRSNKEITQLKKNIKDSEELCRVSLDKQGKELKEHFHAKEKLLLELKTISEKAREEKDSMKLFYEEELKKMKEIYNSELGHRKSSEVRLGRISESLAPFLDGWPWDPNSFRFLGNPIDGIQFNQDELVFVEIKTGKSRLSASQRWIKDLITQGKVSFATFRITENGSTLVKENGNERLEEKEN